MPDGKNTESRAARHRAKRREAKKAAKNARANAALDVGEIPEDAAPLSAASFVTEDDLLAFQISHFGDDTIPDAWIVDAETALNYYPGEEDDGLGYYDDGVKRTLTDQQIEMFRHSEIEQLRREGELAREEEDVGELGEDAHVLEERLQAASPASDASSIESELLSAQQPTISIPPPQATQRQPSQSSRSETSQSTDTRRRQREQDVAYEQRHKRKWEDYIEANDPVQGSLTHRRIIRELDEQEAESVELDY